MFTPLEANLVWHFASRGTGGRSRLVLDDFRALLDEKVRFRSLLPPPIPPSLFTLPLPLLLFLLALPTPRTETLTRNPRFLVTGTNRTVDASSSVGGSRDGRRRRELVVDVSYGCFEGLWVLFGGDWRWGGSVCGLVSWDVFL